MAPCSPVLTSLGAVLLVLLLSTFITGNLHYRQAAQQKDGSPIFYQALSAGGLLPPGVAALRGAKAGILKEGDEGRHASMAANRTPRTRRYLAFIPLLGLKIDDRGSHESERLTMKAWDALALHASSLDDEEHDVELRVVGMVEDAAHCDPQLFDPSAHLMGSGAVSCVTLDPSCRHPEFQGILTMDCILNTALELGEAWGADVYILANGDVVFTPPLTEAIDFALNTFGDGLPLSSSATAAAAAASVEMEEEVVSPTSPPSPPSMVSAASSSTLTSPLPTQPSRGFAMVGRRMDLNVTLPDSPDDPPLTEDSLLGSDVQVRLHPATGIDYFAFTPNVFPRAFPPYLIGRWRWDNALLLHFLLSNAASIDATEVVHALHIGMGSYHSAEHVARAGGQYNDDVAANTTGSGHALGRIDHTKYILKQRVMTTEEEEVAKRQQQRLSLEVERRSQPLGEGQLAALRVTGGSSLTGNSNSNGDEQQQQQQQQTKVKEGKAVLLLPVQAGEEALALKWVCWARRMNIDNYLLLAADQTEARALESALVSSSSSSSSVSGGAGVVWMDPGELSVRGWGGSKAYFEQKRSGQASPAVLALGTGQLMRRLLRLDLAVVLVPSLAALLPLMSSSSALSWPVLEEEGKEDDEEIEKEERVIQALVASLLQPSGKTEKGTCGMTLWEEGENAVKINAALAQKEKRETVFPDEKEKQRPPFTYARVEPTSKVLKVWDFVMNCLKEDVRHTKSRQGWCLAGVTSALCRQKVPAGGGGAAAAAAVPFNRWWDAATSQCQASRRSSGSSSSKGVTAMARDLGA